MTKADLLATALDDLLEVSSDVEAAAVVSADGLPMASALPPSVEEDRLAAMSAALLTLGERAASGLGKGTLGQVFVEGDHGHVVLMAAGTEAVLVAVTSTTAKIGLVLFEMRSIAARIAEIMAGRVEESAVAQPEPEPHTFPASEGPVAPEYLIPGVPSALQPNAQPAEEIEPLGPSEPLGGWPRPSEQPHEEDSGSEVSSWQ